MARLHHRGTECRPRTGEGVVERLEAVADRQARDQPVRDARRLVRALPQHVLQQQAVEAAHGARPLVNAATCAPGPTVTLHHCAYLQWPSPPRKRHVAAGRCCCRSGSAASATRALPHPIPGSANGGRGSQRMRCGARRRAAAAARRGAAARRAPQRACADCHARRPTIWVLRAKAHMLQRRRPRGAPGDAARRRPAGRLPA